MKLLSMTDFLPEHPYSKFLKQPLELWMFVPCDDNGNVLEESKDYSIWLKAVAINDLNYSAHGWEKCVEYQQAKERCLFEGWKIRDSIRLTKGELSIEFHDDSVTFFGIFCDLDDVSVIEDLVKYNLQIKKLGL